MKRLILAATIAAAFSGAALAADNHQQDPCADVAALTQGFAVYRLTGHSKTEALDMLESSDSSADLKAIGRQSVERVYDPRLDGMSVAQFTSASYSQCLVTTYETAARMASASR